MKEREGQGRIGRRRRRGREWVGKGVRDWV